MSDQKMIQKARARRAAAKKSGGAAQFQSASVDGCHIVVNAGAGTGKTSTSINGLNLWAGQKTEWTPSDEQQAIWDALCVGDLPKSVTMCAFNKSIATEASRVMPKRKGWMARTMNSAGWASCKFHLKGISMNTEKTFDIMATLVRGSLQKMNRQKPGFITGTKTLVNLCKYNLMEGEPEELAMLVDHYGVDIQSCREDVFGLVPQIIRLSKERTKEADFADQLWLPIVLDLKPFKVDFMIVDEAQDLNTCQQQFALRAAQRLMFVGDVNQAIYGFTGADVNSIPRMVELLGESDKGIQQFPLMMTRRCGKEIVKEAQKIVPNYTAHESNPEGSINEMMEEKFEPLPGELTICRTNAPALRHAFKSLRRKQPTAIIGRDHGKYLMDLVKRLSEGNDSMRTPDLYRAIQDYRAREVDRLESARYPAETQMQLLEDKVNCLFVFTDDCKNAGEVHATIDKLFNDFPGEQQCRFSSIHRAKGLEAPKVNLLYPHLLPHPMAKKAWEKQQETNLKYVAITRAIDELNYVNEDPKE